MTNGILYGISTGPGDPKLMTLKSVEILQQVSVIAAPRTSGGKTLAYDIAGQVVDLSQKTVLFLDFTMSKDSAVLQASHLAQAAKIEEYLQAGQDVAMLNLGDASVYSTYSYLRDIIQKDGFTCLTIPGVTSFCAVAALLNESLTDAEMPLTILPGSFSDLEDALQKPGNKIIMKPASFLPRLKALLQNKKIPGFVRAVCDCGLPSQEIYPDPSSLPEKGHYFITLLLKERQINP